MSYHTQANVGKPPKAPAKVPPCFPGSKSFLALRFASFAAAFALGAVAMLGWLFQQPHLRSSLAAGSEMKPNTALALMLLAFAALIRSLNKPPPLLRSLGHACAAATALVGVLTLIEYLANLNLGIDEFLFKDVPNAIGTSYPGRMSAPTAWSFLLGAGSVFLLDFETRKGLRPSQWLALLLAAIPAEILVCYVYVNMNVLAFGPRASYMAVPTAGALVAISLGLLACAPESGIMRPLTIQNQAGRMFRRLLVSLLLLPVVLGWSALLNPQVRWNSFLPVCSITAA